MTDEIFHYERPHRTTTPRCACGKVDVLFPTTVIDGDLVHRAERCARQRTLAEESRT